MKKSINFWKTSNAAIEIVVMCCPYCDGEFYELDDYELEDCPLCNAAFDKEPTKDGYDSSTYTLIVDHKTGVPSVIKMDEYEPVVREAPSSQTE
ncbi:MULTISPECIES: hypothetical protein [Paenibacillus]|uniref:hypothetical protein n=1 Tax=Paenibacillus TaxID=44249 RepID=UPI00096DE7AF|nr:hypothetical protein [Paenibacillus odorifer]OME07545.1 hypothetical protein BSK60_31180 [Paenibacillus odorifer]